MVLVACTEIMFSGKDVYTAEKLNRQTVPLATCLVRKLNLPKLE